MMSQNNWKKEFKRFGAKSLSFKSIVAKDKNPLLLIIQNAQKMNYKRWKSCLIDCGSYYEQGLATDITRVFVKGKPSELQKRVYTTVLKMFLHAYNSNLNVGYDIDALARQIYSQN